MKDKDRRSPSKMQEMARRSEARARERLPAAVPPAVPPFPPRVVAGLWFGVLVGALLGLLFGLLLRSNGLVVPGWEGLYSMTPFTFYIFWLLAGAALGILVAALLTLLPAWGREDDPDRGGTL